MIADVSPKSTRSDAATQLRNEIAFFKLLVEALEDTVSSSKVEVDIRAAAKRMHDINVVTSEINRLLCKFL